MILIAAILVLLTACSRQDSTSENISDLAVSEAAAAANPAFPTPILAQDEENPLAGKSAMVPDIYVVLESQSKQSLADDLDIPLTTLEQVNPHLTDPVGANTVVLRPLANSDSTVTLGGDLNDSGETADDDGIPLSAELTTGDEIPILLRAPLVTAEEIRLSGDSALADSDEERLSGSLDTLQGGEAVAERSDVVKAVVRIRPQLCDRGQCHDMGEVGSGAIIHPNGIVLTAWHVLVDDYEAEHPQYADDYIIDATETRRQSVQPRFRADVLAVSPELDLALLRIRSDIDDNKPVTGLPILSIIGRVPDDGQLEIMGYPPNGGDTITSATNGHGGFYDRERYLKLQNRLDPGYSGGPVLIQQNGEYKIVGVVISRRGDLSLIRNIELLTDLDFLASNAWGENTKVWINEHSNQSSLYVGLDVNAVDFVGRTGRLLVYVFDKDRRPLTGTRQGILQTVTGQPVLVRDFSAEDYVGIGQIGTFIGLEKLGRLPSELIFRMLLWDVGNQQVLWSSTDWDLAETPSEEEWAFLPTMPSPAPTPESTPTSIPDLAVVITDYRDAERAILRTVNQGLLESLAFYASGNALDRVAEQTALLQEQNQYQLLEITYLTLESIFDNGSAGVFAEEEHHIQTFTQTNNGTTLVEEVSVKLTVVYGLTFDGSWKVEQVQVIATEELE